MRYIYVIMVLLATGSCLVSQSNIDNVSQSRRLEEKGKVLRDAIAKGRNNFISEGLRRYSYDQKKALIKYGAPDAFDYALKKENPEAATILATQFNAEHLTPSLQNKLLKYMIYNGHNHCLEHSCHMFDYMTWYGLRNKVATPLEHIVYANNTKALHMMLSIYDYVEDVVPDEVQYRTIIAALRSNNDKHFQILCQRYQDTVALAVDHNVPTPLHYAVVLKKNEALKALCRKTTAWYYRKALWQKEKDPLWNNTSATPKELAYQWNRDALPILSREGIINNYF